MLAELGLALLLALAALVLGLSDVALPLLLEVGQVALDDGLLALLGSAAPLLGLAGRDVASSVQQGLLALRLGALELLSNRLLATKLLVRVSFKALLDLGLGGVAVAHAGAGLAGHIGRRGGHVDDLEGDGGARLPFLLEDGVGEGCSLHV